MKFLHLYLRVLELLGREARLGWALATADVVLAAVLFVDPILFGRIVDTLASSPGATGRPVLVASPDAGREPGPDFGLFNIFCSALVALHADRLSHRQRQVVMTSYFEHVLRFP